MMDYSVLPGLVRSEIKPSLGCTEPVAICLAAAITAEPLTSPLKELELTLSSSLFKNAYSVKIPNTGRNGIQLAAALGAVIRDPGLELEILGAADEHAVAEATGICENGMVKVRVIEDSEFYLQVRAVSAAETVESLTVGGHTNLVRLTVNGEVKFQKPDDGHGSGNDAIRGFTIAGFLEYCETVALDELEFLQEAIDLNQRLAESGLHQSLGLGTAGNLKQLVDAGVIKEDLNINVRMMVAAACDFRMGGGGAAAMSLMGSGNQGIEAMVTVTAAGRYLGADRERILRAVMFSSLTTIYIKSYVGRLSPICGATLSGAAASGAITWLLGGGYIQVANAIQNMFGNLAGMVCDGAKDGCALKLAACASEAVMCAQLAANNIGIKSTDGVISDSVDDTIRNIAQLSNTGMDKTDMSIIDIMLNKAGKENACG